MSHHEVFWLNLCILLELEVPINIAVSIADTELSEKLVDVLLCLAISKNVSKSEISSAMIMMGIYEYQ